VNAVVPNSGVFVLPRMILDGDRNSAEGCAGGCRVRCARRRESFVTTDGHERVQRGIDPLDPFEAQLDELHG